MVDRLRKNEGGLWSGTFQAISYVAPAATAASFLVEETAYVGASTTFVFLLALIGVTSAMYMNYVFSGRISHAGGYYAYVRAGLGPKFGIFSGWLYFINILGALAGFAVLFFAGVLWPLIPQLSSNPYGWIPIAFIPLVLILVLLYRGLKPSLKYTIIGGMIEVGTLIIISVAIIIRLGPHNTLIPFTPNGNSFGNLGLATVYSILGFVGIGSVITLSEELHNPKKVVKKSIVVGMLITAVVYILVSYAMVAGYGINRMASFSVATDPGFTVVDTYFGPIVMIIFIIITLNSFLSNGIAEGNAFSREGFALARDGIIFPKSLATVHKKYGSPNKIIIIEWFIIVALTLAGCPIGASLSWPLYFALEKHGNLSYYDWHSDPSDSFPYTPGLIFTNYSSNSINASFLYLYNENLTGNFHNTTISGNLVTYGLAELKAELPPVYYKMAKKYTDKEWIAGGYFSTSADSVEPHHINTVIIISGSSGTYLLNGDLYSPSLIDSDSHSDLLHNGDSISYIQSACKTINNYINKAE